jgi:hypothetical protein
VQIVKNRFLLIFFMSRLKNLYKRYFPYFVDVWQYLLIIVIFILAAIFIL